jgi:1,4-alpha-glucan branching enzyme
MPHQLEKHLGATVTHDGVEFRVWAPFAMSVAVTGIFNNWSEQPMNNDGRGYWSVVIETAEAGQSYKYVISTPSGNKLYRNDPYARQLTISENGDSVIVDSEFDWGNAEPQSVPHEKQIIYELHIGTFHRPDASTAGTFYTAIEKLDYLKKLGVTTIELMPVTSIATTGNTLGYTPNYIFSVEDSYGGRRGMLEFMKACRERGLNVILDVVYNHFSTTDLWEFDGWSENGRGGIYFYNDARGDTPWGGRPDYGRPEVRQYFLDNVTMWFNEFKIDGLRVDSTIYMRNSEGSSGGPSQDIGDAWNLLGDITTLAHKMNPHSLLVAEDSSGNEYITKKVNDGGIGFDAQWGIGFPHAIRNSLGIEGDQTLQTLESELFHSYNGDVFEKVIFSDSHDTASNGSVRISEALSPGHADSVFARKRVLLASAVTLTAPGIPMLLQGQEFMQEGAFNDWKMLDWNKTEKFQGIVLAHQHLIDLRLNKHDNTRGLLGQSVAVFHRNDDNKIFGYQRWNEGGPHDDTLIIVNFGKDKFEDYTLKFPVAGTWQVRFNSSWNGYSKDFHETFLDAVSTNDDGMATIAMSEYSVIILSKD